MLFKPVDTVNVDKLELLAATCPYCAVALPDIRDFDTEKWYHVIPKTDHRFDCLASSIRDFFSRKANAT